MNELIDKIFEALLSSGIDLRLIIIIIALLPIAEARLSIPIAIKCGLSPVEAFIFGFVGSSAAVPILLVALIPLFRFLAGTKLFKRIGEALLSRIDGKAASMDKSSLSKKMLGTAAFVAIPLPLTGVWTGSAVASVLDLGYLRSLLSVVGGNLIASAMVLIITITLNEYINIIMAVFAFIAFIAAFIMLIKVIRPKKKA